MARSFLGAATDRVVTPANDPANAGPFTVFARSYRTNDAVTGAMAAKQTSGGVHDWLLYHDTGPDTMVFLAQWSGNSGFWEFARPAANAWASIGIGYDGGATTNDPDVYVNGSLIPETETGTPTGTRAAQTTLLYVGNRQAADIAFPGYVADFGHWNRKLTATEHGILAQGYSPLFIPDGLLNYIPLVRELVDYRAGAPTATGTTVIEHPRIILPTRVIVVPAPAGGGATEAPAGHAAGTGASGDATTGGLTYEDVVLADTPTVLFPMNEASGNLTDLVAGKTATAFGTPTYGVAGPVTDFDAIQFDAVGDYFDVASHADLDLGDGPYTLECFAARDTDTGDWGIFFHKGTNAYNLSFRLTTDVYSSGIHNVALLIDGSAAVAADSAWHHVVVTKALGDGAGRTKLYVDGVLDVSATEPDTTTNLTNTASPLRIGNATSASQRLGGRLAWLALYKSVLSATRVAAHYAARETGGVPPSGPIPRSTQVRQLLAH